jgi:hypothetical protein
LGCPLLHVRPTLSHWEAWSCSSTAIPVRPFRDHQVCAPASRSPTITTPPHGCALLPILLCRAPGLSASTRLKSSFSNRWLVFRRRRYSTRQATSFPKPRGWWRRLRTRVSQSRGDRPRSRQSSIFELHGARSRRALIRSAGVAMVLSLCRQDGGRKPFQRRERPKWPLWSGRPRRLKPAPACGLSPASDRLGRYRAARSIG